MPSALSDFFSDLVPKRGDTAAMDPADRPIYNPIKIFKLMTGRAWLMYFSGYFAWCTDAWDFFSVSLTIPLLSEAFGRDTTAITTSITLTLLFRSLGAVVFGLLADRYGRKWTLVGNLLILAVLQLGTGFVTTFEEFLALRSLFGIAMGGIWGQSAATAMESVPVQARGLLSGFLQQGYSVGYLFAAVANLTVVETSPYTWHTLFWIGAGISLAAAIVRALLPESQMFLEAKAAEKANPNPEKNKNKAFMRELGHMLKTNKFRAIHAILLMTGFNFLSHGSQDLYPTYLKKTKGLTPHAATVATIIANCGAIVGGILAGWASQYAGRRLTMVVCIIWIGCFIPLWILPNSFGALSGGAFAVQMGVQGAWGVIPIYLNELSPPAFRATFPSVAYQLGNMISSAASQIEATAGKNLTTTLNGKVVPDYAKVQGILIGVVAVWTIFFILIGGENHSSHFESAPPAMEAPSARVDRGHGDDGDSMYVGDKEKDAHNEVQHHETVPERMA